MVEPHPGPWSCTRPACRGFSSGRTPGEPLRQLPRARLRRPEHALALLREYPALARQVLQRIDNWAAVSLEFLEHLAADWDALRSTFFPDADPGPLVRVASGLSDPHRGNRTVIVAHFRSGFRLVYKPRALDVDVHFQELLAWLNDRGDHPPLPNC